MISLVSEFRYLFCFLFGAATLETSRSRCHYSYRPPGDNRSHYHLIIKRYPWRLYLTEGVGCARIFRTSSRAEHPHRPTLNSGRKRMIIVHLDLDIFIFYARQFERCHYLILFLSAIERSIPRGTGEAFLTANLHRNGGMYELWSHSPRRILATIVGCCFGVANMIEVWKFEERLIKRIIRVSCQRHVEYLLLCRW